MRKQPSPPGQIPAFFEPEVPYSIGRVEPAEVSQRAGSLLDHRWTHKIVIDNKVHGLFDESKRIYQTGGELSKFIYWKHRLVSIDLRVWREIIDKIDWIEIIDHERNECLRISGERARKNAVVYEAGIGQRVGVPLGLWSTYSDKGILRR